MTQKEIIHSELSYKINGLLFEIHKELGRFQREKQYGDALEIKLKESGLRYEREKILPIKINGNFIKTNKADFTIEDKILLELKSIPFITKTEYYQLLRYLKSSELRLGMIVNFRERYLKPKRIINNEI